MPDTAQTAEQIEREIEDERAGLARTLGALQDQFSSANIVQTVTDTVRDNGGDLAKSLTRSVKENPLAITLTGVGLAWLILGNNKSSAPTRRNVGTDFSGSRQATTESATEFERRVAAAQSEIARMEADDNFSDRWDAARRDTPRITDQTPNRHSFGHAADLDDDGDDDGRMADIRRKANDAGRRVRATAAELQERLGEGTEKLSAEARRRVIAARRKAIETQARAEYMMSQSRDKAGQMYSDQPLLAGALAFAVGAAVGAALPRTDEEDRMMGEASDQMFADADRIFREETAKLKKVASAAVDEAKDTVSDAVQATSDAIPTGEDAVKMAEGKARSGGKRITDAAKAEAKKQKVRGI